MYHKSLKLANLFYRWCNLLHEVGLTYHDPNLKLKSERYMKAADYLLDRVFRDTKETRYVQSQESVPNPVY